MCPRLHLGQDGAVSLPELVEPVDLCDARGRLNPVAVGWSRRALHRANLRGRGRIKRWEYWAITQGDLVFAVTVSDLDYAALHAVYLLEADGRETSTSAIVPFARVGLEDHAGASPVTVRTKTLEIDIVPDVAGVHLGVETTRLRARFRIDRPAGHEALGVVVPWSSRRFQFTVKENTLPATGEVDVRGERLVFDDAFATVDHGRGIWPYAVTWNWASGSGVVDGRAIGLQFGGAWTDGTGSTENALCVEGRLHYIGDDLQWRYDPSNWSAPWRITDPIGGRVDVTLTPRHVRADSTQLGILANSTHQAFGTWRGWVADSAGERIDVSGIRGWAEEVRNRW